MIVPHYCVKHWKKSLKRSILIDLVRLFFRKGNIISILSPLRNGCITSPITIKIIPSRSVWHSNIGKNLTFDGQGAELIFHGRMLPVSLVHAENCTLRNFSIDFAHPHIGQVEVIANDTAQAVITYRIADGVPYEVRD